MVDSANMALNALILPALKEEGVRILDYDQLSPAGVLHLKQYYSDQVDMLLTPIKLDPAHPFPCLPSLSLNIAAVIHDPSELDPNGICAIINIPTLLDRWHVVPPEFSNECEPTLPVFTLQTADT